MTGLAGLQVLGTIKNAIVVWIGIIFLQELVTKLQVILKQSSYARSDLSICNAWLTTQKALC